MSSMFWNITWDGARYSGKRSLSFFQLSRNFASNHMSVPTMPSVILLYGDKMGGGRGEAFIFRSVGTLYRRIHNLETSIFVNRGRKAFSLLLSKSCKPFLSLKPFRLWGAGMMVRSSIYGIMLHET